MLGFVLRVLFEDVFPDSVRRIAGCQTNVIGKNILGKGLKRDLINCLNAKI